MREKSKTSLRLQKSKWQEPPKKGKESLVRFMSILSVFFIMQILRHPVCARRLSCVAPHCLWLASVHLSDSDVIQKIQLSLLALMLLLTKKTHFSLLRSKALVSFWTDRSELLTTHYESWSKHFVRLNCLACLKIPAITMINISQAYQII